MEVRLNYVLLGVFLVVSLVALALFVVWFGRYDRNLDLYNAYYLYNKELPKGIRVETPVRYLGLPVGFVKSYALTSTQDKVEITLWVKKEILLHQGTRAVVESQGLTGGNYIDLLQGKGAPFAKEDKAVLAFEENWIEKVENQAGIVFDRLEVSLKRLNTLLSNENLKNVELTLKQIQQASTHLSSTIENINRVVLDIEKTRSLVHESIVRGDYNLKEILTPFVQDLREDAWSLNRILQNVQEVIEDFKEAPSGFLFGGQREILGPRESYESFK